MKTVYGTLSSHHSQVWMPMAGKTDQNTATVVSGKQSKVVSMTLGTFQLQAIIQNVYISFDSTL